MAYDSGEYEIVHELSEGGGAEGAKGEAAEVVMFQALGYQVVA